jgi:hypothetical protein
MDCPCQATAHTQLSIDGILYINVQQPSIDPEGRRGDIYPAVPRPFTTDLHDRPQHTQLSIDGILYKCTAAFDRSRDPEGRRAGISLLRGTYPASPRQTPPLLTSMMKGRPFQARLCRLTACEIEIDWLALLSTRICLHQNKCARGSYLLSCVCVCVCVCVCSNTPPRIKFGLYTLLLQVTAKRIRHHWWSYDHTHPNTSHWGSSKKWGKCRNVGVVGV